MKLLSFILVSASVLALASCNGKKDETPEVVSQNFKDEAVTFFEQVEGLISKSFFQKSVDYLIIPSAFAADGKIKCRVGESVKFDIEVLAKDLSITTKCSKDIEVQIRRELLKSLMGETLMSDYGGGEKITDLNEIRTLDLQNIISEEDFWGKAHGGVRAGGMVGGCYDSFTFNKNNGEMIIDLDLDSSSDDSGPGEKCYLSERDESNDFCGVGTTFEEGDLTNWSEEKINAAIAVCKPKYRQKLVFRFKNGNLEYAPRASDLEPITNEEDEIVYSSDYSSFKIEEPI